MKSEWLYLARGNELFSSHIVKTWRSQPSNIPQLDFMLARPLRPTRRGDLRAARGKWQGFIRLSPRASKYMKTC